MTSVKRNHYIHGTSEEEQQRLAKLNDLTNSSFISFVKVRESDNILELGSGLGILAERISRKLNTGKVTGIEISEAQITRCPPETNRLVFVCGDGHDLPFSNDVFDVIYCRFILEHVLDPMRVLSEAKRVLKPGGCIYIQENAILLLELYPDCPGFKKVWRAFAAYQDSIGGNAMIGLRLHDKLKRAGFEKLRLSMAPEIHYFETGTWIPWINNLIGNIRGARIPLIEGRFITKRDFEIAEKELEAMKKNSYASSYFYWNRAFAKKPR